AHTASESTAQNKIFVYEPHLVSHLAEAINPEKSVCYDVQTYALYALDAIARHRNKLNEILHAFNASANHGTLLYILRHLNNHTEPDGLPNEFLESLFTLLAYLLQTQPGGQMLMTAGVIPTLLNIVDNQESIHLKNVTKVVGLLDTIVNNISTSFSAFCNANGLDILLARIKSEVTQGIENATSMETTETKLADQDLATGALAPYDRVSLVKAMFKFLIKMMESTGTADGLRNLIDSSAPSSLIQVIENPKVFGNSVFALATNVTSTFIHNEPTSLAILQEQKLPQCFLQTISRYENPNGEVLVAAVHAFGALCLNGPGLEMFNDIKPLPHFFDLMTSHDILRNPAELEGATVLGNTMDELIRHHPSLRQDVFQCVTQMIKKVLDMGQQEEGKPSDNGHLLRLVKSNDNTDVEMTTADSDNITNNKPDEKVECLLVSFIDLVSRFLEGLFQNQSNIREFVKDRCPEMLLDYFTLPMLPADFSVSIASDSLSYLFRMIADVSPIPTVMAIVEKVKTSAKFILDDYTPGNKSLIRDYIDVQDNDTEKIKRGNQLLRQFIVLYGYIGLLANTCCSSILTHGKNGIALVNEFISQTGDDSIILLLGQLHRTMVWENILLRESVPKSWYNFKSAKKSSNIRIDNPLGISDATTTTITSDTQPSSATTEMDTNEEKEPDAKDPRVINTKHFKMFLGEIPQALTPIFQGLNKVSVGRRSLDSGQIGQSFKLAEQMTQVLKDNISWSCIYVDDVPPCKYDYLASMFSLVSMLLLDDRATPCLHVPMAVTFDRNGGTTLMVDTLDKLWQAAESIESIPIADRSTSDQETLLPRIDASIELLLAVLLNISSEKLLMESPYTFHISKAKDRSVPEYFDPREWNVSVSLRVAAIRKHLQSKLFYKFPKYVLRMYIKVLAQLMSTDLDKPKQSSSGFTGNLSDGSGFTAGVAPSPFNSVRPPPPPPVVPNEAGVQTLVDMGFNRPGAEQAMVRCNNQISRAVDYLFSHPTAMLASAGSGSSRNRNTTTTTTSTTGSSSSPAPASDNQNNQDSTNSVTTTSHDQGEQSQETTEFQDHQNNHDDNDEDDDDHDIDEDEHMDEDEFNSEDLKSLKELRNTLRKELPEILLQLVDERDDMIFDAHDLLVVVCKDGDKEFTLAKSVISSLVDRIQASLDTSEIPYTKVCSQLRLMALLLKDSPFHAAIPDIASRLTCLFDILEKCKDDLSDPSTPTPTWLASALLVLEMFICQSDEPKEVKLTSEEKSSNKGKGVDTGNDDATASTTAVDDNDNSTVGIVDSDKDAITDLQRQQLLLCCITLLRKTKLTRDDLFAILRIIVRLTKNNDDALRLVEHGGLELLFAKPRSSLEGFQGQQAFIILILRHIIEDKFVLEEQIDDIITTWGTVPRPKNLDITTYFRNNAAIALRDPAVFLQVSEKICRLTRYNEYENNRQIKIIGKEDDIPTTSTSTSTHHSPSKIGKNSSIVVNHLLNELVSIRSSDKENSDLKYAYTGFLLQCLVELVSSYPSCKYDIYNFSRQRANKNGNNNNSRSRHHVLNLLVNDLLPYNAIKPTDDEARKGQGLSMWTSCVLVAMCYNTLSKNEITHSNKHDLTHVRRYVLEGVVRAFQTLVQSTEQLSVKYNRYLSLADLCHRILNARPNPGSHVHQQQQKEDTSMQLAKIMLDKGFVGVMTSAISDVDVNYPHAKTVLSAMIRPLEQLTKLAVTIERKAAEQRAAAAELEGSSSSTNNKGKASTSTATTDRQGAPDLYRNSSLGMFDGSVMEEDEDDFGSSEDEEDEFDEETGSDLSDMSEEELEDDDVDQEMDDGSDNDDNSDESDHNDESSDHSGGSEDDEDGREMTWHLEDIDDDGEVLVGAEISIESDDEQQGRHHHQRRRFEDTQDVDLDTLDQSDFDEEEGSEGYLDDEPDTDLNDGLLIDEDDLGDPFLVDDGPQNIQYSFDVSDEGWQERPRTYGGLGLRRPVPIVEFGGHSSSLGRTFRGIGGESTSEDITTHPLLADNQGSESTDVTGTSRSFDGTSRRHRGTGSGSTGLGNLQAFEDIIGGSALRVLENIISQASNSGNAGDSFRMEMPGHGLMRALEMTRTTGGGPGGHGSSSFMISNLAADQSRQILALLHEFQPMSTSERWNQEARMMYGNTMADQATKLTNALLNSLIPIALEENKKPERKKAEEEKRQREEKEAADRKAEEERLAAEQLQQQQQQQQQTESMETGEDTTVTAPSDSTTTTTAPATDNEERTTITINGESVDISGTGIDVEFLEALPDDLREEVVNQHMRERRESIQPPEDDSISPEFLDALPSDIRDEVLRQEAIERDRRERQRRNASNNNTGSTAQTTTATDQPFSRMLNRYRQSITNSSRNQQAQQSKKPIGRTDTVQLVDRTQLATLARLLFVPQSISKNLLNKLLLNLCENSKTRGDLLSLLICILHDGSVDLAAVDKSFAQLSLYPKTSSVSSAMTTTPSASSSKQQRRLSSTSAGTTTTIGDNVPNLITQRCLEVLHYVVSCNEQSLTYFLTENDCLAGLKRSSSKKGKNKDVNKPSSKYPLLVLMSLLDRPVFVDNTHLMEQLMNLLATMCRPFPALVKKYVEKVENRQQQEQQQKEQADAEASEEQGKNEQQQSITESSGTQQHQHRPVPKPPTIPDHYLQMVVHVLTSGECSSRTFQYTLGVISHLSALDGALQTITHEFTEAARFSGKQILNDLQDLLRALENAMTGTDIQTSALTQFSAASSHQAKLLRVLKTIDYMYSRKRQPTTKTLNADESDEQVKNENRMLAIYDQLNFLPLWKMLGDCLSVIHEKEELINVATVLLPLIESFMVVSKYAESMTNQQLQQKSEATSSNRVSSPEATIRSDESGETPDDVFFKFTEDHKKILNIMVRNNPTLMSGSFSLLVRNPKMLEFDNKRNYFVQQLHKRTEPRSHYPPLQLNVRRQYVFEDSYHQLQGRTGEEIKFGKLMVRFYDEEGVDAGGVTREWFSVLARQMFDPNYALFIASAADKLTYQPNRASWVNSDHLSFFKFVGRVIGKAIYDGRLLDAYFTRSFYKHILNRSVDYRDVEAVDPEYYKSLVWILDNDITDIIDLTFSMEMDDFGTTKVIDLKPGGRDIPVTEQNKHEYVNLVTAQKLTIAIKDQINAFLQGFHDIIPASLIQIFNEQELELLISGLPDIDLDDWKNNTEYVTYHSTSPQIQWFWRAVRSFDQEERAKLLQFATGTSKVPLEGFAHLQGSGGVQKFQIHKDYGGDSRLPSAHTCFNQVDLPEYDS
ncbi:uncharacterized protein BX664DRAFT_376387, partial [Halteromyces radiatus]|uniref:uncharacterized protein n=1 Tax=Halteromyces radiatus TaxID=101107 RepID=UPI00221FD4B9